MKFIFKQSVCFVTVFALCLLLSSFALAQEITGTIVGTVRDASGSIVPGANVVVTDTKKNTVVRSLVTNDDGEFSAPNLDVGVYTITIEAKNFKKSIQNNIKLDVGQRRTVAVELEAGKIEEVVTVEADPLAVDLSSATSGTLINGDQVREIPVNNRNWVQLVTLAPGVSNDLADQVYVGTTNPDGQANTINISVNGARSSQNTFTVDGADITDRGSNITIQAYPSVDSIGEFRVLRGLFPAEAGRSGGGQVNVVTRSGERRFHGSVYEFIRNEAFNANSFFNNAVTTAQFGRDTNGKAKRPPFRYNNYGWTLGGPVYFLNFGEHDPNDSYFKRYQKTFFFFSQEFRKDNRSSAASVVTVPDANLRNGIFPIDVCLTATGTVCTETLTAGTALPANRFSPTALAYLNGIYRKLPLPNAATAAAPYNLSVSLPGNAKFRQEILKIDHSFSDNWKAYYRYQHDDIPTIDANALFSSGSGLPGVSTTSTNSPGETHTAQTTYVISPKLILEGRYSHAYGAILSENIGTLALVNTNVPIILPFANEKDRVPTITGNGFTGLTSFGPYDNYSTKDNFNVSLTWIFGSHNTKYGVSYSTYRKFENALAGNNEGIFNAFATVQPAGVSTATLNQNIQRWAYFLQGKSTGFSQAHFDYIADLRQKTVEAYAQDEWRIRRNLTLSYGVRYSYFPSPYDEQGRLSNFEPTLFNQANAVQVTGAGTRVVGTGNFCNGIVVNSQNYTTGPAAFNCTPGVSPYGKYIIKNPKTDFAPRVGLAWDPFGKGRTSIRTGYGIYHEQVLVGTFEQNIGTNPPYQETLSATGTAAAPVSLDNPSAGFSVSTALQSLRAVQSDWHTPYMQHWTLDVQQQLAKKTVVTVGYYGSKGTHLIGLTDINDIAPGAALNAKCAVGTAYYAQNPALVTCQPAGYVFRATASAVGNPNGATQDNLILDQLRPYRGFRSIAMVQPRYNSNYHSLQISATQRFTGASQVSLAYTFSKNFTDSQNDRTTAPQNTYDTKSEYSRAVLDRRHILTINYIYELPFFSKQEGFVGKVLGGWQASGIFNYVTGLPFTVTTSNLDLAGTGLINANPSARPNLLCDPNVNAPHTVEQWFNIACFQANPSNTAAGLPTTIGSAQRGVVEGPPTTRMDFTLAKNLKFALSEKDTLRVQLRAEVFNIFNKTNFRGFITNGTNVGLGGTNFGRLGTARDPRTMQFSAKVNF